MGAQGPSTRVTTEESTTLKYKMNKIGASNHKVIASSNRKLYVDQVGRIGTTTSF